MPAVGRLEVVFPPAALAVLAVEALAPPAAAALVQVEDPPLAGLHLSLIHISEPTRPY